MFIFQAVFEWAFERPLFVTRIDGVRGRSEAENISGGIVYD